jgi:DNA-binding MarR family transcriptional regulator
VTETGAEIAERSTEIVDRVHREVLDALAGDEREVFVRALDRLAGGALAEPVESPRPVRRARQRSR